MNNKKFIMDITKIMDLIRILTGGLLAGVANYFMPIHDFFLVIALLFTANFFVGWFSAKVTDEDFDLRKAFAALKDLFIYLGILVFTFIIGKFMKVSDSAIIEFISWITWLVIYFYIVNVTKNLKYIAPDNRAIDMLYWFVNVEFIKKIKFVSEYFKSKEQ